MSELAIPQSVNDKIRARVKETIFDMLPDEALQAMIDDMLSKQLMGDSVRYTSYESTDGYRKETKYNYGDPANFYTIIHNAIRTSLDEKIKSFVEKLVTDRDSDIFKSLTKEIGEKMFDSILSEKVSNIIQNAQRGY